MREIFKSFLSTIEKLREKYSFFSEYVYELPQEAQKECNLEMKTFRKSCLPLFRNPVNRLEINDYIRKDVESILDEMDIISNLD